MHKGEVAVVGSMMFTKLYMSKFKHLKRQMAQHADRFRSAVAEVRRGGAVRDRGRIAVAKRRIVTVNGRIRGILGNPNCVCGSAAAGARVCVPILSFRKRRAKHSSVRASAAVCVVACACAGRRW